jgi:hypothetical protein
MKTSEMKLLMMEGLIAVYDRDQRTTPEVVRISKASSIVFAPLLRDVRIEMLATFNLPWRSGPVVGPISGHRVGGDIGVGFSDLRSH